MAHIPTPRSGDIEFVGKGNQPAKFVIIPKDIAITNEMGSFVEHFMFTNFGLSKPKVLLSVTGGAQEFKMLSTKLEQVFNRGIVRAAENTDAWIVTGGLDSGVMQFVGDAIREQDFEDVPCIGIATLKKVSHYETLAPEAGKRVLYSQQKPNDNASAALNPDHTHFILVDSPENKWGEEIAIRAALEDYISRVWQIPLVLIVVNGGPGTIATVVEGVENRFPVIIVEGSGRAADAIAGMLKAAKGGKGSEEAWNQLTKNMDVEKYKKILLREKDNIILYNPNDDATEDMDIAILRAVLSGSRKSDTFRNKLFLGVEWGRSDIILDLFDRDEEGESTSTKLEALNQALQMSLELNRPEIFDLLVDKGAQKEAIDLKRLYKLDDVKYLIDRMLPYSGSAQEEDGSNDGELSTISNFATSALARAGTMEVSTYVPSKQLETAKKVLKRIHPMYYKLLADGKTTFADMLVWAIMVNRHDLAKAIWKRSALPIHTAICASHLYRTFAEWFQGDNDYPVCAEWFENQAIKVLDKMDYKTAKKAMKWEWLELEQKSALEIAEIAECKDWMSHQYVQRYLDSVLYSDDNGKIMVGTRTLIVLLNIIFPFTGHYKPAGPDSKLYHFYHLPIVKFWSSTLTFMLFLFVIGYVVVSSGDFPIFPMEYVLWTFVLSTIIEEFQQFLEDPENYFVRLSNKMDGFMLFLLLAHIIIRIAAFWAENAAALEAAIDILIIASICCWMKLLYMFTFSKTLGPLFFVIMGLIKDVGKWMFIFAVFMISFQIGFTALTKQVDPESMWTPYPDGTLGVSFVTIIGDFGYAMETMKQTHIGVILLAAYALIAQIMLVNLLIAMMGDTYGDIKDNSDKEWKFFRFSLVSDYSTCSPRPPPFNLLLLPFSFIATKLRNRKLAKAPTEHSPLLSSEKKEATGKIEYSPQSAAYSEMLFKKMKISRDRVIEDDEKDDDTSIQSLSMNIRESLRVMNTQRDSDRIFLEQNLKVLQDALLQMQAKVNIIAAQAQPPQPTSSTSSASTTTTTTTTSS